jgi:hypothetical protein
MTPPSDMINAGDGPALIACSAMFTGD